MTRTGRFMTFFAIALSVWTLMHVYVASRLWNLPLGASATWHRGVVAAAILLWFSFPVGQILARVIGRWAVPIEALGVIWIGALFLVMSALLAADLVTGFGWLLPSITRPARLAALIVAAVLGLAAVVQALRPPVVVEHQVAVRNLPPDRAGLRIVQLSDVHLGLFLRTNWLEARVAQVQRLHPDLIVVTGDVIDQDAQSSVVLPPVLRKLSAPLGVWGVTGNHELYSGLDHSLAVLRSGGIEILRDRAVAIAPGLVLAGVDDLTARRQLGSPDNAVERALTNRPQGVTIFLCHSPWEVERAAALGVDLMLSGHTHDGQIWPFRYLVRLMYPFVAGRYEVNGMTLVVSRGTGFWGPPMRLFRRGEVTVVVLRSSSPGPSPNPSPSQSQS